MPDFDWNDIPLLLALARAGSLNAAAQDLGVDASTVSRRVAAAERRLNARLFVRDRAGVTLTEAGRAFVARAEDLAARVNGVMLATASAAETVAGSVRISAIDFLFDYWLVQRLPALLERYPGLEVSLLGANRNVSFTRQEADFALRLARPAEDASVAMRKLGELGWAVFGARGAHAMPREAWRKQAWIVFEEGLAHLPETRWVAREIGAAPRMLRVDSLSTMVQACQAGLGLALLPTLLGAEPGLRRMDEGIEVRRELWLLSHRDTASSARIRHVSDWLADTFRADHASSTSPAPDSDGKGTLMQARI
jgi:DNA-binding transcriptional LysR family regulator